jgi:hypothetical protein
MHTLTTVSKGSLASEKYSGVEVVLLVSLSQNSAVFPGVEVGDLFAL